MIIATALIAIIVFLGCSMHAIGMYERRTLEMRAMRMSYDQRTQAICKSIHVIANAHELRPVVMKTPGETTP